MTDVINLDSAISLIVVLALVSLIPFTIIMTTSFIKISVVLSLMRNALGVQQIPPNSVIHGLAIILSVYVMAPVINQVFDNINQNNIHLQQLQVPSYRNKSLLIEKNIFTKLESISSPLKVFLKKNSNPNINAFFYKNAKELWPVEYSQNTQMDSFIILVPSFTVSELSNAFKMGFMIYLPFLAIDLVISNILLAMGMIMVSPMAISIPFKLFLFVFMDGWCLLIENLLLSYTFV